MVSVNSATSKFVTCPTCGAEVLSTMRFCVSCGVKMPGQRTCPNCKAPIDGNPKFCRSCGKTIILTRKCPGCNAPVSGDPEFCKSCGAPLLDSRPCPACGAGVSKNAKFCNGCGRVMGAESQVIVDKTVAMDYFNKGLKFFERGQHEDAIASFDKALKIDPDESKAWHYRGLALSKVGRYADAIASYNKVLAISPEDFKAWTGLGIALGKMDRYDEAVRSYGRALKISPDESEAWTMRGNALIGLGRYDEAVESCDKAIRINPDDTDALHYRGIALDKIGRKADAAISPALKNSIPPANPELFLTLNQVSFALSTWHKMEVQITNTGKADAFFVTLSFSSDFDTRRIKPTTIEAGSTKVVEIGIMPKTQGTIPIEVTLNYKDESNREYVKTNEFWIDVPSQYLTSQQFKPETEILKSGQLRTSQSTQIRGTLTMRSIPPEMTEKYVESEFIGKGGFARVFKAKRRDGALVAVKVPIDLDESTGKSFLAEMQNWTKFSHPNIVKIYDYNIMPLPYFEEELCDSSLDKIQKPIDSSKAAWIIFNICEGLKYAHARQVIHRDLKPQNILLKNGIPKISDWGLSKVVSDSTSSMTAAFTPYYAAPEQVTNKPKDQRTDIWQVGVILYELVTSSLPFTGDSMLEILATIPTQDPVPPGNINPEAKKIEPIILRCMEKDPAKRYPSVIDLQKDLAIFLKMDFKESLQMSIGSKNIRQTAILTSQLLLTYLKSGDLHEAYKYATDLVNYSEGEIKVQVNELSEQLRMRIDYDSNDVPDEIIKAADLIAHKIGIGFTTL